MLVFRFLTVNLAVMCSSTVEGKIGVVFQQPDVTEFSADDAEPDDLLFNVLDLGKRTRTLLDLTDIAVEFDARNDPLRPEWKACPSIGHIRDQGHCGNCFAHSTSAAMSDRLCIAGLKAGFKGKDLFSGDISVNQATTCPFKRPVADSCKGGHPRDVYKYAGLFGLPTGSDYNTSPAQSCVPTRYEGSAKKSDAASMLVCQKTCDDEKLYKTMKDDLQTIDSYWLLNRKKGTPAEMADIVKYMQREIMNNGPITAALLMEGFDKRFPDYDSTVDGVYSRPDITDPTVDHDVRIVGWGVSKGLDSKSPARRKQDPMPYWIVANSWGPNFGNDGFFLVERGVNALGIESKVTAPMISFLNPCDTATFCAADRTIDQAVWTDIYDPNQPLFLFQGQCAQQVGITGEQKLMTVGRAFPTVKRFFRTVVRGKDPVKKQDYRGTFDGFWLFDAESTEGSSCKVESGSAKFLCVIGYGPKDATAQACIASNLQSGAPGRICWNYKIAKAEFGESSGKERNDKLLPDVGDLLKQAKLSVKSFLHLGSSNIAVFGRDAASKSAVAMLTIPSAAMGGSWKLANPGPITNILTCAAN